MLSSAMGMVVGCTAVLATLDIWMLPAMTGLASLTYRPSDEACMHLHALTCTTCTHNIYHVHQRFALADDCGVKQTQFKGRPL